MNLSPIAVWTKRVNCCNKVMKKYVAVKKFELKREKKETIE